MWKMWAQSTQEQSPRPPPCRVSAPILGLLCKRKISHIHLQMTKWIPTAWRRQHLFPIVPLYSQWKRYLLIRGTLNHTWVGGWMDIRNGSPSVGLQQANTSLPGLHLSSYIKYSDHLFNTMYLSAWIKWIGFSTRYNASLANTSVSGFFRQIPWYC